MARERTLYVCRQCGYETHKWLGRCPACEQWNCFAEDKRRPSSAGGPTNGALPVLLNELRTGGEERATTGIGELDRVLGGGLVAGSVVLIGGDPGIGKSTLLLQAASSIAGRRKVLYVAGEESPPQVKMRADRLGLSEDFFVLAENCYDAIAGRIEQIDPDVLIVDSIQTIYRAELGNVPGSVTQVREVTAALAQLAKKRGMSVFIIGHVTKEGVIAGPRLLEHMVDCVLYFEGERYQSYRILRSIKNRFGPTNELGVFTMESCGLVEVVNPSALFLSQRLPQASGSVVIAGIEGTRPLLVEIQALVTSSSYASPRRTATGLDFNRLLLIVAVLEKKVGLNFQDRDIFVSVAGGVRLTEPAVDLGLAVCLLSAYREQAASDAVIIGEVGLAGEVRAVSSVDLRVREALKLGFTRCIVPYHNRADLEHNPRPIELTYVATLREALEAAV